MSDMTQATWEKPQGTAAEILAKPKNSRLKFMVAGLLVLGAVFYLIIAGTVSSTRYFITVEEVLTDATYVGQTVRLTGAVIGDTIDYDERNLTIAFDVAHIPAETDDLANTLFLAANDESAQRLPVFIENEVKPDLLTHEAQAILTGTMGEDGVFYANELLLKCPSRFEEGGPEQSISAGDGA
jgi:cytochrome c-type biogenesis protein CcmE